MKSVNNKQVIAIAGVVIIIVLLLFANTKLPKKQDVAQNAEHSGHNESAHSGISAIVESAKKTLTNDQNKRIQQLEKNVASANDKKSAFELIINTLDTMRQPILAAFFMEKAAETSSTEQNWEEAGNRYYVSTRFLPENDKAAVYQQAMVCFENVLKINPLNTETKINLASCYVEGSSDPMKGITMLREIEKTDSNNVNLQLNFAFFSEKSGQWDKAIARFNKVLKIQPDFIEAYLHLADAYERKGDKKSTIESLKKYVSLVDDVTIKTEVQSYINELSLESAQAK
ncbi:MAG: tetratricopeptide repeat protein [Bacteroidia bacterium]